MSEQGEKSGSGRAKRWTEAEAREALREFQESGLSAVAFAAKKGVSPARLPYWAERLRTGAPGAVDFVAVAVPSQQTGTLEIEHQGVIVRMSGLEVEAVAQLVVAIARRARTC
jgi:hypothetical protein